MRKLLCILLVLFLPLTAFALEWQQEMTQEELLELMAEITPEEESEYASFLVMPDDFEVPDVDVFNLLLIGFDSYTLTGRGRSDTILLLQIDVAAKTIKMVSFMRDTYLKIPGAGYGRINASYAYGGPDLLLKTIKENFGITVDAYLSVNFSSLIALFDAIGGVEVEVTKDGLKKLNGILEYYNYMTGVDSKDGVLDHYGVVNLTGKQAMSYCRIRKLDSDFVRTNRQRRVIESAFRKIMKMDFASICNLVTDNIDKVITDLTLSDLIKLIPLAFKAKYAEFSEITIPAAGYYQGQTINGAAVMVPNLSKCVKKLNAFLYGE